MLTNEQLIIMESAAREYEDDGVISTTTFIALTNVGLDAEVIIENIEDITNG